MSAQNADYKALRLHKHATGATTGVVYATAVGFQHLDEKADHAARRVELAAQLALRSCEFAEEVFVDAVERIAGDTSTASKAAEASFHTFP